VLSLLDLETDDDGCNTDNNTKCNKLSDCILEFLAVLLGFLLLSWWFQYEHGDETDVVVGDEAVSSVSC